VNTYAFVKYPEYTLALVDSFNDKTCKLKIEFCFDPNAGIPTDMMKSQIQAGLISLYKEIEKKPTKVDTPTLVVDKSVVADK
jgi:hypothetical protein